MRPFLVACLLMVCPLSASAQPLADKIPGDALIYVGWRGLDKMGPDFKQSHFAAMLEETQAMSSIDRMLPLAIDRAIQMADPPVEARAAIESVKTILPALLKHPTALGVSILLPTLNLARERGNRAKAQMNLHEIGTMMYAYKTDFKKFPPDLGELAIKTDLSPEVFTSPSSDTVVPQAILHGTPQQQADWINKNSDFVYVAGLKVSGPADTVMAYEKPQIHHGSGGSVLYLDAHVEWKSQADLERAIQTTKQPSP